MSCEYLADKDGRVLGFVCSRSTDPPAPKPKFFCIVCLAADGTKTRAGLVIDGKGYCPGHAPARS